MSKLHNHLQKFFKVFCNQQRLQVMEIIRKNQRINASEILKHIKLSQPTLSHHLKVMHEGGIINAEKSGKEVYYTLRTEEVDRCCDACQRSYGSAD